MLPVAQVECSYEWDVERVVEASMIQLSAQVHYLGLLENCCCESLLNDGKGELCLEGAVSG